MLKIKDTEVGKTAVITLLVKVAEIKLTKNQKPYLFTELTDGQDTIKGQDWDWGDKPAPAKNSVFTVSGPVTEYMGAKQINIKKLETSDLGVELFAPTGDVDLDEEIGLMKDLIDEIMHTPTRELVKKVLNDNANLFKVVPAANGMHHAYVHGLIEHTVAVTRKALSIAELTPMANTDLVVAGALLHDFGKIWTYQLNGAVIEMTDEGMLLEHMMLGAMKLEPYRNEANSDALDLILHIISSHHGVREWGAPTTPKCIEALIVHFADSVDAKSQMVVEESRKVEHSDKWMGKIWAMDNKPVLNPRYISKVFGWEG